MSTIDYERRFEVGAVWRRDHSAVASTTTLEGA